MILLGTRQLQAIDFRYCVAPVGAPQPPRLQVGTQVNESSGPRLG